MAILNPTSLVTGRIGLFRDHFAQLNGSVVCMNGHDANKVILLNPLTAYDLGIAAPGAAPTGAAGAAGNVTGDVRYRARWRDSRTGTLSLPSAALAVTCTDQIVTITAPGSPPARADYWVVERTVDGGDDFFPLNLTSALPNGTLIGANYDDNETDSTIRQRFLIGERQGQPRRYEFCWSNKARVFGAGSPFFGGTATVTNGSPTVSSIGSPVNSSMIGHCFYASDDSDGTGYRVIAVPSANSFTLDRNYTGSTRSTTIYARGRLNSYGWCDAGKPEEWGAATEDGLSNEVFVGTGGGALVAGCGLGESGNLLAKFYGLYAARYTEDPDPVSGDGEIVELPTKRGAISSRCLKFVDGYVYGMDSQGIWRMAPGGLPEEIGTPLHHDFIRRASTDFAVLQSRGYWAWIEEHPLHRQIYFAMTTAIASASSIPHPARCFVWSTARNQWVNHRYLPVYATAACVLPDNRLQRRLVFWNYNSAAACGAYPWMEDIGYTAGVPSGATLSGTVTAGGASTLTASAATFPTTGEKLKAVTVTKIAAATGNAEGRMISTNTGTQLTAAVAWTVAPVAGDTFRLGEITSRFITGRLTAGTDRKKMWRRLLVWVRKLDSAALLYARWFMDDTKTSDTDARQTARNEDAVSFTAAALASDFDSTQSGYQVFQLGINRSSHGITFNIGSIATGTPWEIVDMALEYEIEDAADPRKK